MKKLNLNMTAQALTGKINVANEKDSQVISVTAEDKDPKTSSRYCECNGRCI